MVEYKFTFGNYSQRYSSTNGAVFSMLKNSPIESGTSPVPKYIFYFFVIVPGQTKELISNFPDSLIALKPPLTSIS